MSESFQPSDTLRHARIAVFTHSHPSLTKGGAEIAAHTLVEGLRAIGLDAILIACCADDARGRLELGPGEFAVYYDPLAYDDFYHLAGGSIRRQLLDILARERVTLFNAHHFLHIGVGAFADVARAGVEIVLTLHEFLAICHNHGQMITTHTRLLCERSGPRPCHACFPDRTRQQFAVRQINFKQAFEGVAGFVSPSQFLVDRFIAWGAAAERMHVIENGVIKRPHRASPERAATPTRVWKVGFFGQINPFKGMDTLLEACAILARTPEAAERLRLVIHGNFVGQSPEFLERFDEALKLYPFLAYAGPYDNAIVGRLMAACDYVLAPSSWWENSPVVIQEAYEARRPVICTGIGGMAEKVIDGETGLHFARNDAVDLAARIVEAADPELYSRLQANLPAVMDAEQMAQRYAELYDAVLASPINPPAPTAAVTEPVSEVGMALPADAIKGQPRRRWLRGG